MERSNSNWFRPNSSKGVFGGTRERGLTTAAPVVLSAFQILSGGGDAVAPIAWDYSLGYNAKVTLSGVPGVRTLAAPTNVSNGDYGTLIVVSSTVGYSLTLPASFKVVNGGAGAITISGMPLGATDVISWVYDGTNFLVSFGLNFT